MTNHKTTRIGTTNCLVCGPFVGDPEAHKKTHICTVVGVNLRNRAELEEHMRTMHGWDRPFTFAQRPMPIDVIRSKHDFDHSAGFKFTAAVPHAH